MTGERLLFAELLAKAGDGDFRRSVAEAVVQLLMKTDVEGLIGTGRHERSGERTTHRNSGTWWVCTSAPARRRRSGPFLKSLVRRGLRGVMLVISEQPHDPDRTLVIAQVLKLTRPRPPRHPDGLP